MDDTARVRREEVEAVQSKGKSPRRDGQLDGGWISISKRFRVCLAPPLRRHSLDWVPISSDDKITILTPKKGNFGQSNQGMCPSPDPREETNEGLPLPLQHKISSNYATHVEDWLPQKIRQGGLVTGVSVENCTNGWSDLVNFAIEMEKQNRDLCEATKSKKKGTRKLHS